MDVNFPIESLKGVGPKTAQTLRSCSILTIKDLILYFPRDYENLTFSSNSKEEDFKGKIVLKCKVISFERDLKTKNNKIITTINFNDGSKNIKGKWFNQPYIKKSFQINVEYYISGKLESFNNGLFISNPKIVAGEGYQEEDKIIPKYALKDNITNTLIMKLIKTALEHITIKDNLPSFLLSKYNLISLDEAIRTIHSPSNKEKLNYSLQRLKFQELLAYSLKVLMLKDYQNNNKIGISFLISKELKNLKEKLPFELTKAQSKAIREILLDQKSEKPMNRLVQGDVGSGKTIVAIIAMFNIVMNDYQAVMMAPTEILARQHHLEVKKILQPFGIEVGLLTGSLSTKEKDRVKEKLENGEIQIIVGTHAVIQEDVKFNKLGFVVTDEQHRFGVMQRTKLINKGEDVDTLVMSATPIPRTLTLCLYGDLDVSIINQLPPGRKTIKTYYIEEQQKERAYKFAVEEINKERQVYIVCPLIEENQELDLNSVEELYVKLKNQYFKEVNIEMLHGRMTPKEKEEVMNRFKQGKTKAIVSTTVIEVGVNVPNATLMIIENAERFGLAQLHQLRGRVGRGEHESFCILISTLKNQMVKKKMEIMKNSNDGFYIAEQDLKIRGAGEIFGFKQHGESGLILSDLIEDLPLFKKAHEEAKKLLISDEQEDNKFKDEIMENIEYNLKFISFN